MFSYKPARKYLSRYSAKLLALLLVLALIVPLFPQPTVAATEPWAFASHTITRSGSQTPTNPFFTDYRISLSGHAGAQNYSISVMRVENGSTAASVADELNSGIESEMVDFAIIGSPPVDANDNPNILEFSFEMELWGAGGLELLLEDKLDFEDVKIDDYDAVDDPIDDPNSDENIEEDFGYEDSVGDDLGDIGDAEGAGDVTADTPSDDDPQPEPDTETIDDQQSEPGTEPNDEPQPKIGTEPSSISHFVGGVWGSPAFNIHGLSIETSYVPQSEPSTETSDTPPLEPDAETGNNHPSEPDTETGHDPQPEPDTETGYDPPPEPDTKSSYNHPSEPDTETSYDPDAEPDTETNDIPEDKDDEENTPVSNVTQPESFPTFIAETSTISPAFGSAIGTPIFNIHGGGTFSGGSIVLGYDDPPMPGGFESLVAPTGTIHFTWPRGAVSGGSEIGLLSPAAEYLNENGTIREEFRDSPVIVTVALVITPLGFGIEREQGGVTYTIGNFRPILESDVIIVVFDYNLPPQSTGDPVRDAKMLQMFQDMMFNMRFIGDPIDAFSGNFYWYYTDLTIHSDPPMHFTRFYNSQDDHVGMLGRGWRHNFYIEVVEDYFGVKLVLPSGSEIDFFFDTQYTTPTPPVGWEIEVVWDDDEEEIIGYDISGPNGIGYTVREGVVTEIFERGRLTYTISHTGDTRRVTRVNTGAWFDISPSGVTDSTGRHVAFVINGGFLTQTTNPDGNSLVYTYTSEGFIESIVDFMGVNLLTNEYMAQGRVTRQNVPGIPDTFYEYRYDGTRTYFTDKNGVVWTYSFAGSSNPVSIADDNGETLMTYNEYGLLTSITDRMGLVTTFEYEGLNLVAINYPDGTSIHLTYNANGVLTSETDRNGFTTYFNNSGTVDRVRDGNGNTTTFIRDSRNHLVAIIDREGNRTNITTNNLGNPLTITTPDGQTTVNTYDAVGRLTSTTTPLGRTTTFRYTPAGKLEEVIDPDGVSTVFANNANGFTTLVTNRMGHSMAITYNESGQITSMTDFSGNVTTQTFNEFGNLAEIRTPMGGVTRFGYDQYDNLTSVTNPLGGRATFEYDLENRLTGHTDPFGNRTSFTYNARGQVSIITAPNGGNTAFTYDAFGRILTQTDALGGVTQFTYDGNGNLLTMRDPMGNVTTYTYDNEDRLTSITNALGEVTRFEYDTMGRLIRIIDAMSGEATFDHDNDGMLTERTDEEGRVTTFTYDPVMNRIISRTDPDGEVTTFTYDLDGRITSIHNPGQTRPYRFEYDANGNLTSVTDPMYNVTTFVYDRENRLISETDPMGHVTAFAYDYAGNLVQVVDALSGTITMTYDRLSRMTSLTNQNGVRTDIVYDSMGNITRIQTGNLAETRYEYDLLGRMVRGTNELGETSEYLYNALGLRVANVQRILPGHMGGHGWDVNGYLTDEPNSPGSRHINVNRQALAGLPATVWLEGFADADSANAIDRYLWQGELPDDIPAGAHQRIFKDNFGLNRNSGVVRQEFVIDYVMGFNQDLMVVEEGGFSTVFVYGTPLRRLSQHTTRADSIVSGVAAVGGALDPGGNVAADIAVLPTYAILYYRLDFRNSTSQMQLPNGQYIAWTGFDDWGATTSPTDHDMNMAGVDPVRFTSHNFDRVLGLFYAQNRWYDPRAKRFLAPDPKWIGGVHGGNSIWGDNPTRMPNAGFLPDIHAILQSTNLYAYVMNNPVNFVDPRGLNAVCPGGGQPTNHNAPTVPPLPEHIAPQRNTPAPQTSRAVTGAEVASIPALQAMANNPDPPQNRVLESTGFGDVTGYNNTAGCEPTQNFASNWDGNTQVGSLQWHIMEGYVWSPHNDPLMDALTWVVRHFDTVWSDMAREMALLEAGAMATPGTPEFYEIAMQQYEQQLLITQSMSGMMGGAGVGIVKAAKKATNVISATVINSGTTAVRMTSPQATTAAQALGYRRISVTSHGQPVFQRVSGRGPRYITPDVDSHIGGTWKGANSVSDLGSRTTRSGTFDANLSRIGD